MEVLSPELVLVSSDEDARRAREQLPEPPWQAVATDAKPPTRPRPDDVLEVRRRRRGGKAAAIVVVVLAAAGAAGYFAETSSNDGPVKPSAAKPRSAGASDTVAQPPVPAAARTRSPQSFVPARTWTWLAREGADSYEVTFFLNGQVVLQAHPTEARLVMPSGFRYRAGRYRWTVIAIPRTTNARALVDSAFVVTPAAAVAANGR